MVGHSPPSPLPPPTYDPSPLPPPPSPPLFRSDVDPDNTAHEDAGRRLFEGMLQALKDVSGW